ncbi:Rab-related GTPase family protein [Gregarina niphandrodes]|uniref:Rab-related GTPase family protein n=1 Tax=Gregarina niphandrodes TaxID=110365 RepID=A0A023B5H8_GRENI|nr:Rab-related GTPase family protein [Gregarina niphandrodes]EZG61125.1 Rab-related GTPase family protein [Gregarina niphandrodes]|eukprot:XP_011130778.1 Rab-related GTPase family protein [Gregarina niphandrodes]
MTVADSGRSYDAIIKLLLIGNSGVGKSSCLLRYVGENFDEGLLATIGVDFRIKYETIGKKTYKLAVWDTAGQERFRGLTSSYYKGAQGVILMYDVSDRDSFASLDGWMKEIQKHCNTTNPVLCVIGNKIDTRRNSSNFVSTEEGREFAMAHQMLFVETSAKTSEGIELAFDELVHKVISHR